MTDFRYDDPGRQTGTDSKNEWRADEDLSETHDNPGIVVGLQP